MKNKIKYLVVKDKKNVKSIFFQCDKIDGFNLIKEKKKIIKGVSISKILIVNKKFYRGKNTLFSIYPATKSLIFLRNTNNYESAI